MLLLSSADFFKISVSKYSSRNTCLLEYQMVVIHIRTDVLLVLIWFQTVYKCYQQTIKFVVSKEREFKNFINFVFFRNLINLQIVEELIPLLLSQLYLSMYSMK